MSAYTLAEWNALISDYNELRLATIAAGCDAYDQPFLPASDPFIWTRSSIYVLQSRLLQICSDISYTPIIETWSSDKISELINAIATIVPCNCTINTLTEEEIEEVQYATRVQLEAARSLPLIGTSLANSTAQEAYTEWTALDTLLTTQPSEAAVTAQVAILNSKAATAWSAASAIATENPQYVTSWSVFDGSQIKTGTPVLVEHTDTIIEWFWRRTLTTRRIQYYNSIFGTSTLETTKTDLISSPSKLQINAVKGSGATTPWLPSKKYLCANLIGPATGCSNCAFKCAATITAAGGKYEVEFDYATVSKSYGAYFKP